LHNRNKNRQHATAKYRLTIGVCTPAVITSGPAHFAGTNRRLKMEARLACALREICLAKQKAPDNAGAFFLQLRDAQ